MKFNHTHYVPILKTKAGERWAVDHLKNSTAKRLTPLFEIHRHKTKDEESHAADVCESLASVWGTARPFFLDTRWLHDDTGDADVLQIVFEAARDNGLQAIPIVRLSYDEDTLDVIADITAVDDRGYLLRVPPKEADSEAVINAIVQIVDVARSNVHLLVDYRHHPMDLPDLVPRIPHLSQWATFTAAAGAFPRSLAALPLHAWHDIPRHDWTSWLAGVGDDVERKPAFGDYLTRDPGPAAEGGRPSVNLRYTRDENWIVQVGGKFGEGKAPEMHEICAELVQSEYFDSTDFSTGDDTINDVAEKTVGPGAPQQWIQWGMNHHLEYVVDQLRREF